MATDARAKLAKLLDALTALDEHCAETCGAKRQAIYAEMAAALGKGEGIGSRLQRLKAYWCLIWTERHKEKIEFDHVAHTGGLKKKALAFTNSQIETKMANYLACDEAYYVRARHPFGLFLKTFDTWRGMPEAQHDSAASDTSEKLRGLRGE